MLPAPYYFAHSPEAVAEHFLGGLNIGVRNLQLDATNGIGKQGVGDNQVVTFQIGRDAGVLECEPKRFRLTNVDESSDRDKVGHRGTPMVGEFRLRSVKQ